MALALVLSVPAAALVYVMPTDESMVDRTPVIVFGQVRAVSPGPAAGSPSTDYSLEIEEVLKGPVSGSMIVVRQPGGVGADATAMWIAGLPMLAEGDRVLLFLRPEAEGAHRIAEYALGMFWEVEVAGGSLLLREPSLQGGAPLSGDTAGTERSTSRMPRDGERFRQWIADRTAGVERPNDYYRSAPADLPARVASPYRLSRIPDGMEGCLEALVGFPLRWQEFDRGENVGFTVHSGGQAGFRGSGLAQVRAGMRAWNNDARSRADLVVLRTTDQEAELGGGDGVNSITYEDPHDEVEGSYVPSEGGTLAVTQLTRARCRSHGIPGGTEEAVGLVEANITTQDGFGDALQSIGGRAAEDFFERIMAHELGHALGIDHPCEPEESGCDSSHRHYEALMFPTADNDGRRAYLSSDDQAAVRHLYPAQGGGTLPPPDPDPPPTSGCTPTATALQFDGGYEVSMCYRTPSGEEGQAKSGVWASGQSGILWFFDRGNAEVLVKVLDGCAHNGHRWVFVAPVTTVEFNLWVTAPNGRRWTHSNRQGQTASTRSATSAFSCADENG